MEIKICICDKCKEKFTEMCRECNCNKSVERITCIKYTAANLATKRNKSDTVREENA